jgi:anti-sigma B factor antagonist
MTAKPTPSTHGPGTVALVCDVCGERLETPQVPIRDWFVLWLLARRGGWTGTDTPFGPHHCPGCVTSVPTRPEPGARRPPAGAGGVP